jgi:hypothetical protein
MSGSGSGRRVTPAQSNGSGGCAKPRGRAPFANSRTRSGETARGSASVERRSSLPSEETRCRCQAHGRHRHETRPEGRQAE